MQPLVTIISTNYNHGKFLRDTIESVRGQSYKNIQHIVVDGGSTDDSLVILKNYPNITVISKKDEGSYDAFCKGLALAKGDYVMQCAVTDGYLDMEWVKKCVEAMERDREVSLVWGLPRQMTESGTLKEIVYPQFHRYNPPRKPEFIYYWLNTFFWFPEGNFCVRKNVFQKCFRPYSRNEYFKDGVPQFDPWLEFNYHFHRQGYLPHFIRSIANFGRVHGGQKGQQEVSGGVSNVVYGSYIRLCRAFRKSILASPSAYVYHGGDDTVLSYHFSVRKFRREQLLSPRYIMSEIKHISRPHIKKIMRWAPVARLVRHLKRYT
ncbi:MAG: glycosyltransferase [bacterium]|nr:glycosyltransferase [bacterium]